MPLCIENGLCGLGCGLQYLIQNGFLEGDINEILEDIDSEVIKEYNKPSDNNLKNDLLLYLNYRGINNASLNID